MTVRKSTKIYNARARPLFCSFNFLFGGVLVTVAAVVCQDTLLMRQNVRHVRDVDLYLTRLALVPLCLHVVHSVRTSSGFFFFSAVSASLLPGRLPLLGAEESALDSTLGFYS